MAKDLEEFDRSLGSLKNLFITEIAKHTLEKKTLRGPFHRLGRNISFASWKDHALPLYSWAALTTALLNRDEYLAVFRKIVSRIKYRHDNLQEELFLDHASLKTVSNAQFDFIFEPLLLVSEDLRSIFARLAKLTSLPDRDHWDRYGDNSHDNASDFSKMAAGFAQCFDHQSQQSTDIRWMIVMNYLSNGRIVFGQPMEERFLEYVEYPNRGDMRSVRPSIRALEITLRGNPHELSPEKKKKEHEEIAERIWDELYAGTNCMPLDMLAPKVFDYREVAVKAIEVYKSLIANYFDNVSTTGIDARLDGSHGLAMYTIALLIEGIGLSADQRISAKLILRTILEAHINLRFLTIKDDPTIWLQYRNYGSSQAKLTFLKFLDAKEKPDYVDIQELYQLANEDVWLEYQDINLGSWANKSLRDIAIEAGLKGIYDQHYPILSTSSHAQWSSVRESNFTQCVNPLHRYHRIPDMPRFSQENLIPDMCKLINQMLEDVNKLYPPFKERLRGYKDQT